MGLRIYTAIDSATALSRGTFTTPLFLALDGRNGETIQQRLYIRNDDSTLAYSGISIQPIDTQGDSRVDGTDGFSVKLFVGDQQPTESGWATMDPGEAATFSGLLLSGLEDLATYEPFWIRATVPGNVPIQNLTDIKLRVSAEEILL